jgi:Flp pilus assembly protein TadG
MKKKYQRGSALIEFVLIAPVLMLILFGIADLSLLFFNQTMITNASREGARYGIIAQDSVYPTSAQITSYITTNFSTFLVNFSTTMPPLTVTVTKPTTPVTGNMLTVKVSYPYTFLILSKVVVGISSPITLTATAVMAYE